MRKFKARRGAGYRPRAWQAAQNGRKERIQVQVRRRSASRLGTQEPDRRSKGCTPCGSVRHRLPHEQYMARLRTLVRQRRRQEHVNLPASGIKETGHGQDPARARPEDGSQARQGQRGTIAAEGAAGHEAGLEGVDGLGGHRGTGRGHDADDSPAA
jgi:hypothetical protein